MFRYFCVDESGSFNTSYERYYVISAIITEDNRLLQNIHKVIEKEVRKTKKSHKELKAAHLKDYQKALFINEMLKTDKLKIISLVIDKKILYQKYQFNITEFMIYNYALKELIKAALEFNLVLAGDELLCLVDNRTMNHKIYNDLESYLNLEFFDKFERLKVVYKDSNITREIQMADYISNTVYGYYNQTNQAYQKLSDVSKIRVKIIPKEVKE